MNIQFELRIASVLTDATSVVLSDPTATFGIRRTDTGAVVEVAGTALTHTGTGLYEYDFVSPDPDVVYNYWIEWVYAGKTYRYEQNIGSAGGGNALVDVPEALPRSCISLPRYAQLTGYTECALMGVSSPTEENGDCENPIWSKTQRDFVAYYLAEAQEEIEKVTGYPLCPTYFAEEEHPYKFPIRAKWNKILAVGTETTEDVASDAAIDYSIDPALIGPLATSLTDATEIRIFYPDSEREIEAKRIIISGGFLRIYVPRCRLVHPDFFATPQGGIAYEDLGNFLTSVDVKRFSLDNSVNAELVWSHRNSAGDCPACGCLTCGEHTETACLTIRSKDTGSLEALRGTFANGTWTPTCSRCFRSRPDKVRVNYLAGLPRASLQAENAVLRLAHAKMPYSPCGCDVLKSMWERDTHIPDVLTRERENCPFGMSDGAWTAWKFANSLATFRMSTL